MYTYPEVVEVVVVVFFFLSIKQNRILLTRWHEKWLYLIIGGVRNRLFNINAACTRNGYIFSIIRRVVSYIGGGQRRYSRALFLALIVSGEMEFCLRCLKN